MEGALNRALPQQGGRKSEGPQLVPRSVPDLDRRKHSTGPTSPSRPTSTTKGVCAGIPAWTGGRHFLGMANPVPQPNRGAAAGCNSQRLQESKQAPGVENVSRRA